MKRFESNHPRRYYHYCVDIMKSTGKLWFTARFSSKAIALVWCDGFRHGICGSVHPEYSASIGRHYVKYFSIKAYFDK